MRTKSYTFERKVLDQGYLKYVDNMGGEEAIIEAARMSTGRGFEGWEPFEACSTCNWRSPMPPSGCDTNGAHHIMERKPGDAVLLEFLYSNRHMTPFEMVELKIEVYAPLMVFREWHRHRTQSYNEFSARYAVMPNDHYVPDFSRIAKQSKANKQGSGEPFSEEDALEICSDLGNEQQSVYQNYERLIQLGVANEIARINTPVSRYSKMTAKANLRNWLQFLSLRMDLNAQKEIRQYANAVGEIIKELYPRTFALWVEHEFFATRFSRTEMRVLRQLIQETREQASGFTERAGDLMAEKGIKGEKKQEALWKKLTADKAAPYADVTFLKDS